MALSYSSVKKSVERISKRLHTFGSSSRDSRIELLLTPSQVNKRGSLHVLLLSCYSTTGIDRWRFLGAHYNLNSSMKQGACRFISTQIEPPLASEWIHPTTATSTSTTVPTSVPPKTVIVFLHGLLGNRRNIMTMAKSVCNLWQLPGLLVDVTGHGQSKGRRHRSVTSLDDVVLDLHATIRSAAADMIDTNGRGGGDNDDDRSFSSSSLTLIGHSMGGRVSLQYAGSGLVPKPDRIWLLDTVPGQVDTSVTRVLQIATELQQEYVDTLQQQRPTRKQLTSRLTSHYHLDVTTAQWLATSLDLNTMQYSFDLQVAHDLAQSMDQQDVLRCMDRLLESCSTGKEQRRRQLRLDLIRGGRNQAWDHTGTWTQLHDMQRRYGSDLLGLHTLPNAGHWVHMDDLPGLLQCFSEQSIAATVHK